MEKGFTCISLYGARTRKPLVQVTWTETDQTTTCVISPEEARDLASNLLQCAEAAEQDGFIVEWAQEVVGVDEANAAKLMHEYRLWRAKRAKEDNNGR